MQESPIHTRMDVATHVVLGGGARVTYYDRGLALHDPCLL
jgi:hypothetical protein